QMSAYIRGVRAALARQQLDGVIFGHAGDGHVHVNPLVDVRRPDWREQVSELMTEITALVAALGGTLAGEHGDGRLRTPLLGEVIPPDTASLFALVKRCFDPRGILNPGVKVPLTGQTSLGDIKYDPLLPPLPAPARAALDEIERTRGWGRFRLSLVGEEG
ncbi:MAG: FAD-binding oxidoreductase, partial [Gemmatimonadaceae bacterium]